jgi:hypothetical protein
METRVGVGDLMGDTPVEQVLEGASPAYLASRRALVRRVWPGGA